MKHSIPPTFYDAAIRRAAALIPPSARHQYLVVHIGSGGQSSSHLRTYGFQIAYVDWDAETTTSFRSVSPTLVIDYDSQPIMATVRDAAHRAGFNTNAVIAIFFDPCCKTRSSLARHHCRYPSGCPLPGPAGEIARYRDLNDAHHLNDLDEAASQRWRECADDVTSEPNSDDEHDGRGPGDDAIDHTNDQVMWRMT